MTPSLHAFLGCKSLAEVEGEPELWAAVLADVGAEVDELAVRVSSARGAKQAVTRKAATWSVEARGVAQRGEARAVWHHIGRGRQVLAELESEARQVGLRAARGPEPKSAGPSGGSGRMWVGAGVILTIVAGWFGREAG